MSLPPIPDVAAVARALREAGATLTDGSTGHLDISPGDPPSSCGQTSRVPRTLRCVAIVSRFESESVPDAANREHR